MALVDDLGVSTYWRCADHAPPVAVLPPRNVGYARALVRSRITAPLDPSILDVDADDAHVAPALAQFGADRSGAPARFVDRLCDRLATLQGSIDDHARMAAADRGPVDPGGTGAQTGLETWGEAR